MKKAIKTNKLMLIGPTPEGSPLENELEANDLTSFIMSNSKDWGLPTLRIISIHKVVQEYADLNGWQIGDYIRAEIRALMDSDAVVMLDDWEFDPKCTSIHRLCLSLGIPSLHARSRDLREFLIENFGTANDLPESFNNPVLS